MRKCKLISGLVTAVSLYAQAPSAVLLVLSKADQTLSVVDPATLKVLGRMPSGPDPHEVAVSADGRFAYVSNYGGGGGYNTLTMADLYARQGLIEDAKTIYEHILARDPNNDVVREKLSALTPPVPESEPEASAEIAAPVAAEPASDNNPDVMAAAAAS